MHFIQIKKIIEDYMLNKSDHRVFNQFSQKEFSRITSDSRNIINDSIFFAIRGASQDGHQFIDEAFRCGASLVVGEDEYLDTKKSYIRVTDSRAVYALCSTAFYGFPSSKLKVIGVTGTSGKTTTTFLIESILKTCGLSTGLIGTVAIRWNDHTEQATHTTPDAEKLQSILHQMLKDGVQAVVMEVSSHALEQKRVFGVEFDVGVFTNLSSEHMDYHKNMENYFSAKAILFNGELQSPHIHSHKKKYFAIHANDPYGEKLIQLVPSEEQGNITKFGHALQNEISFQKLLSSYAGIQGEAGGLKINSPLLGDFNMENICAALSAVRSFGFKKEDIERGILTCNKIPGRLEEVKAGNSAGIKVLVDYAHKPDAVFKVLRVLSSITKNNASRLITVIGCGGDRDKTKRPVMAKTACEFSDFTVLTSDNPRSEDPIQILEDMKKGVIDFGAVLVEVDRKLAISKAISHAKKGDIVLIAGKGHEDYQIVLDPSHPGKTKKIWFDDRVVASEFL